jgi:acyl-CoA thioesterase FadM
MEEFVWRRRVGFGDCDPAQIAYTGRIVEFALEALDAFWEDLLDGEGWFSMNVDRGVGMPFVRMEYDFRKPIVPPEPLFCHVIPKEIGTSSITLAVRGVQRAETAFEAHCVSVFVARGDLSKIAIPAHIRAALEKRANSG